MTIVHPRPDLGRGEFTPATGAVSVCFYPTFEGIARLLLDAFSLLSLLLIPCCDFRQEATFSGVYERIAAIRSDHRPKISCKLPC